MNEEEYKKVIKGIPSKKKKYKLMFEFLYYSGLRINELINIQVKDVTFKVGNSKGKVYIKKRKRGKAGCTTLLDYFTDNINNYVKE